MRIDKIQMPAMNTPTRDQNKNDLRQKKFNKNIANL